MEQKMNERKRLAIVIGGVKFYALAVVAVAALTACTNDSAGEVMNDKTAEVRMTFSPYDVEPMTRAAVADYATRLDVWIYDGTSVKRVCSTYFRVTEDRRNVNTFEALVKCVPLK